MSTLAVAEVPPSRYDIQDGGLFSSCGCSLIAPEGQLSSCGVFSTLVLAVGPLSSCGVPGCSSLVLVSLGKSSLVVEWEHLSCFMMLCVHFVGSSLFMV